jgi:hypothetical protein
MRPKETKVKAAILFSRFSLFKTMSKKEASSIHEKRQAEKTCFVGISPKQCNAHSTTLLKRAKARETKSAKSKTHGKAIEKSLNIPYFATLQVRSNAPADIVYPCIPPLKKRSRHPLLFVFGSSSRKDKDDSVMLGISYSDKGILAHNPNNRQNIFYRKSG